MRFWHAAFYQLWQGGTGLYVDALLDTRSFEEEPDTSDIRAHLRRKRPEGQCSAAYEAGGCGSGTSGAPASKR